MSDSSEAVEEVDKAGGLQSLQLPTWTRWLEPIGMAGTLPLVLLAKHLPGFVWGCVVVVLAALWILRLIRRNGRPALDFLSLPVYTITLVFVPASLWVSVLPDVTFPRTLWLLWCLGLFSWIANDTAEVRWKLSTWVRAFVCFGVAFAFVGLVGMNADSLVPGWLRLLPESLTYAGGIPTNELAGTLLIFLAPILGLILAPAKIRPISGVVLIVMALFVGAVLLATKSRGGLLGAGVIATVLAFTLGGKRGLIACVFGAVSVCFALLALWQDSSARMFVLGDSMQGTTWSTFLSGRFLIWEGAAFAIRDAPLTGLGIGTFGAVLDLAFPVSPEPKHLEDAHQHFLQAGTDFGVAGGVIWLWLWGGIAVMLAKLQRRLRSGKLPRYVAIGLFAAFCSHLLFNLFDSVSPGWPGQVAFWFLAGLTVRMRRQVLGKSASRKWLQRGLIPIAGGGVLAILVAFATGGGTQANALALRLHRALLVENLVPGSVSELGTEASSLSPNLLWLKGLVADRLGETDTRDDYWRQVVRKSRNYWRLVRQKQPLNLSFAETALEVAPDDAMAHFWLSAAVESSNAERSLELLKSGLVLDPRAGREWLRLGDQYSKGDDNPDNMERALRAFANACRNGDPGANGCARAGSIAEQLGRPREAFTYYRASNWEVCQQRARELDPKSNTRLPLIAYVFGALALLAFSIAAWLAIATIRT